MGLQLNAESIEALNMLASEKNITLETLLSELADAIEAGYKGQADSEQNAWVTIDPAQMEFKVLSQEFSDAGEPIGEELDITPENFGRIATQNIRQVLTQGIREVEWDQKYEEYAGREGEVVTGIVKQSDPRFTLLDLGSVEALLPSSEQVPYERPETGTRLKAYIVEVRHTLKGPQVVVSRTHPGLIKRLFEVEVPEIAEGIVEILACSREPGHRTKISVYSHDENIDPVGACVGARGVRVRPIVNELLNEKIDIVPYSANPQEYVSAALSPAKVKEVLIDEETNIAEVIVPAQQLSLAIGREGQNARLAARLTGYIIDVRDDGVHEEEEATDWASGEWVTNKETGEQFFHPADGSTPITVEEWKKLSEEIKSEGEEGEKEAAATEEKAEEKTEKIEESKEKAEPKEVAELEIAAEPKAEPKEEEEEIDEKIEEPKEEESIESVEELAQEENAESKEENNNVTEEEN